MIIVVKIMPSSRQNIRYLQEACLYVVANTGSIAPFSGCCHFVMVFNCLLIVCALAWERALDSHWVGSVKCWEVCQACLRNILLRWLRLCGPCHSLNKWICRANCTSILHQPCLCSSSKAKEGSHLFVLTVSSSHNFLIAFALRKITPFAH